MPTTEEYYRYGKNNIFQCHRQVVSNISGWGNNYLSHFSRQIKILEIYSEIITLSLLLTVVANLVTLVPTSVATCFWQ